VDRGSPRLLLAGAILGVVLAGIGTGQLLPGPGIVAAGFAMAVGGLAYTMGWLWARSHLGTRWGRTLVRRLDDPGRPVSLVPNALPVGRLGLLPAVLAIFALGLGILVGTSLAAAPPYLPLATGGILLLVVAVFWRASR
jgi:hypothetical protein